jgi:DnaJ family protein C protein 8
MAIKFFSQSIDIDPDNHITYSNRSAAYMKADSKSKALHDAEKVVELAPTWAKGYNRLGVAQQSLKRFDAAIDSFKKGLELDPNNKALWDALKSCQDAFEIDKKDRFSRAAKEREEEQQRLQRRDEIRQQMMQDKKEAEQEQMPIPPKDEENVLAGFFSDVGASAEGTKVPAAVENEDDALASFFLEVHHNKNDDKKENAHTEDHEQEEQKSEKDLTEKYVNQDLGTGKSQVERLLAPHYQWRNLNPFYVLGLDIDATIEDIKFRYKKLSLKIHPDRLRNMDNAREAFEAVKEAYNRLMDEDQRRTITMHIENVTNDVKKERKKLLAKGIKESDLKPYEQEREIQLLKHFADLEQMRRLSEKNRRVYSAREKQQEEEEEAKLQKFQEFENDWSEVDRREKRVGNWRDFQQHEPANKRVKAVNYKEEEREETKFGTTKVEEWRKKWK